MEGASLTDTEAGTFKYTWLQSRPNTQGVQQVRNLYLEQGTETGVFAFPGARRLRGHLRRLLGEGHLAVSAESAGFCSLASLQRSGSIWCPLF